MRAILLLWLGAAQVRIRVAESDLTLEEQVVSALESRGCATLELHSPRPGQVFPSHDDAIPVQFRVTNARHSNVLASLDGRPLAELRPDQNAFTFMVQSAGTYALALTLPGLDAGPAISVVFGVGSSDAADTAMTLPTLRMIQPHAGTVVTEFRSPVPIQFLATGLHAGSAVVSVDGEPRGSVPITNLQFVGEVSVQLREGQRVIELQLLNERDEPVGASLKLVVLVAPHATVQDISSIMGQRAVPSHAAERVFF